MRLRSCKCHACITALVSTAVHSEAHRVLVSFSACKAPYWPKFTDHSWDTHRKGHTPAKHTYLWAFDVCGHDFKKEVQHEDQIGQFIECYSIRHPEGQDRKIEDMSAPVVKLVLQDRTCLYEGAQWSSSHCGHEHQTGGRPGQRGPHDMPIQQAAPRPDATQGRRSQGDQGTPAAPKPSRPKPSAASGPATFKIFIPLFACPLNLPTISSTTGATHPPLEWKGLAMGNARAMTHVKFTGTLCAAWRCHSPEGLFWQME
jgi:hypothetical protein